MDRYVVKGGKSLRYGYTTGSCAAGAAKACAFMLLFNKSIDTISLDTPKGWVVELEVLDAKRNGKTATCAIKKDSGNDPDITNGALIYTTVTLTDSGISIDGGEGVGKVTMPGLACPVGEAAINPMPRKMIAEAVKTITYKAGYKGGFHIVIHVPEGRKLAKKTFNEKLGIVGGISILGTTGIVEPMSEDALRETIKLEINMLKECGKKNIVFCPGNYGYDFATSELGIKQDSIVKVSNFIGDMMMHAKERFIKKVLLVAHLGKGVKLAGGMLNTHSKYGDCRMEIICAHSVRCGVNVDALKEILECVTTDGAINVLIREGKCKDVIESIACEIEKNLMSHVLGEMKIGVVLFNKEHGMLATSTMGKEMLEGNLH
jgi:cobalt-precorrin-5B (C1)-methyltransferase